jgi:hypothetical protein
LELVGIKARTINPKSSQAFPSRVYLFELFDAVSNDSVKAIPVSG